MNIQRKAIQSIERQFTQIRVIQESLKKPSIQNTILLNCLSCPSLSANEIKILSKPRRKSSTQDQLAPDQSVRIITKLKKILMIWLDLLEKNEESRKNFDENPIPKQILKNYEQIIRQSQKVASKTDVKQFINKNGKEIFGDSSQQIEILTKKYHPIFFLNNYQNYNPVGTITEAQYLIYYEQVIQSILTMTNLLPKANSDEQKILQLFRHIENQELFTKFDNKFNQILKYNIYQAQKLTNQYRNVTNKVYQAKKSLRQGAIICYYMCFLVQSDILSIKRQADKLAIIKFLTNKQQQVKSVFPKIYQRKINKLLIKLEHQEKIIKKEYGAKDWYMQTNIKKMYIPINNYNSEKRMPSSKSHKNDADIMHKQLTSIQQRFQSLRKPIQEQNFMSLYTKLQQLCLKVQQYHEILNVQKQPQNFELQRVLHLINQAIPSLQKQMIDSYLSGRPKQTILPKLNDKNLIKNNPKHKLNINKSQSNKSEINKQQINQNQLSSSRYNENKVDQFIKLSPDYREIFENSFEIEQQSRQQMTITLTQQNIVDYLLAIKPENGETLQDRQSLNTPYLNRLLQNAQKYNLRSKQITHLQLFHSCTKASIKQSNLYKLVKTPIKVDLIKILFNKFSQHAFKLSHVLENIENQKKLEEEKTNNNYLKNQTESVYTSLPPNIIEFISIRNNYVKAYLRNISQVIPIIELLIFQLRIQTRVKHDLCSEITQNFLLKSFTGVKEILSYLQSQNYIPNLTNKNIYFSRRATEVLKIYFYNPLLDSLLENFTNNRQYRLSQLYSYCEHAIKLCDNAEIALENFRFSVKNTRNMVRDRRQFRQIIKPIVEKSGNQFKQIKVNLEKILQEQIDFFSYENFKKTIIKIQFYESICEAYITNKLAELAKSKDEQAQQLIYNLS